MSANKVAQDFIKAINTQKQKPSAYDTKGEVMRITEGIAWVHLAGGIDETPCELTIGASVGDIVQVRVAGGRAWLVGNSTEPPVGDKHVQNIIKKEKKNIVKDVEEIVPTIDETKIEKIIDSHPRSYEKPVSTSSSGNHRELYIPAKILFSSEDVFVSDEVIVNKYGVLPNQIAGSIITPTQELLESGNYPQYTYYSGVSIFIQQAETTITKIAKNINIKAHYKGNAYGDITPSKSIWTPDMYDACMAQADWPTGSGSPCFTTMSKCDAARNNVMSMVPSFLLGQVSDFGITGQWYYNIVKRSGTWSWSSGYMPVRMRVGQGSAILYIKYDDGKSQFWHDVEIYFIKGRSGIDYSSLKGITLSYDMETM